MIKDLLSDLYKSINPSYQPDTFHPYFSTILTIITITILFYGFQTATNTLHIFADTPTDTQNKIAQITYCKSFYQESLRFLCGESTNTLGTQSSFVQDLQSDIN